jgi:chorismate mutase
MPVRGLRGATVAADNTPQAILAASRELLAALVEANQFAPEDVASLIFTVTSDLDAEYPARAARELGWLDAAMVCLAEMPTQHGLARCIRVLIHWNTERPQAGLKHIYLHAAAQLRPDRAAALTQHRPAHPGERP